MIEGLNNLLEGTGHPGLAELRHALGALMDGDTTCGCLLEEQNLQSHHPRVYRLRFAINGEMRSLVVKRLEPALAQRNQFVVRRWLPALGLGESGPKLLGIAAELRGECVWHIYEDFGNGALDWSAPDRRRVQAVVELMAQLHTRAADHPLLPEFRLHGGELGIHFFTANVGDAIRCLAALRQPPVELSSEHEALCEGLLERLHQLAKERPHRARALAAAGGPETLLHGDLWLTNTLTLLTARGWQARLIDWDHAAVGPLSYDLSTFLLRFRVEDRCWILELYRDAVARAGWELPAARELNLLFETAEFARYANRIIWPAIALAREGAAWGYAALAEVEQWFADWSPVLPEEEVPQRRQLVER